MTTRRPCWDTVNDTALQPDNLPRVLAAMDLDGYLGTIQRGAIKWWPPGYLRPLPCEWPPGRAQHGIAAYRARLGPINRAMRDADVVLMQLGGRVICIDTYQGEWRAGDGANRGRNLLDLGVWRWACRYGQAGNRIARLCGIGVPTIQAGERWAFNPAALTVPEATIDA